MLFGFDTRQPDSRRGVYPIRTGPPRARTRDTPQAVPPSLREKSELAVYLHRQIATSDSSTTVEGKFMLRMAALAFRTHLAPVDLALEVLRQALGRLGVHPEGRVPTAAAGGPSR